MTRRNGALAPLSAVRKSVIFHALQVDYALTWQRLLW